MKLLVIAHGDKDAGELSKAWEIPCPFEMKDASPEDLEVFSDQIISAFSGVIDWPISAEYIEGEVKGILNFLSDPIESLNYLRRGNRGKQKTNTWGCDGNG